MSFYWSKKVYLYQKHSVKTVYILRLSPHNDFVTLKD